MAICRRLVRTRPVRRKQPQRARHDLAGGAEVRRDLLLGHLDRPVARRVKQQEVGQTPLQFVGMELFELQSSI